jgi:hypothetical protein
MLCVAVTRRVEGLSVETLLMLKVENVSNYLSG